MQNRGGVGEVAYIQGEGGDRAKQQGRGDTVKEHKERGRGEGGGAAESQW